MEELLAAQACIDQHTGSRGSDVGRVPGTAAGEYADLDDRAPPRSFPCSTIRNKTTGLCFPQLFNNGCEWSACSSHRMRRWRFTMKFPYESTRVRLAQAHCPRSTGTDHLLSVERAGPSRDSGCASGQVFR